MPPGRIGAVCGVTPKDGLTHRAASYLSGGRGRPVRPSSQWGSPGAAGQVPAGRALTAAFFNNSGQSLPVGPGGSPRAKAGPSSGTSFSFYSGKNMAKMKATEKPARLQWFLDLNRFILCVFFSFFSFVAKGKRTQRIQQHNETCNELESPAPSRSRR